MLSIRVDTKIFLFLPHEILPPKEKPFRLNDDDVLTETATVASVQATEATAATDATDATAATEAAEAQRTWVPKNPQSLLMKHLFQ